MHAVLPPSAAHRWVNCPGSVQAEAKYPDRESDSSREGTAAHWVAEQVLNSYRDQSVRVVSDFIDKTAPNGIVITDEIADGVAVYVTDVLKRCQDGGYLQKMQIEQTVMVDRVSPLNWGTPDCWIFDASSGHLTLWDFKFGRVPVENHENWQLIDYTIGVLDSITGGNGISDQMISVELRIVQPRAFHPDGTCRNWIIKGDDLRTYANQLKLSAEQSQLPNPPCKSGDWCGHCLASHSCHTLQKDVARVADRIETLQLIDMTPENTAVELRYLEKALALVKERYEGLSAQALEQQKNGVVIPGYSIGYGRGSTVWTKPDSEVIALGDLLGVDFRKPEAPITPTQAKKLKVDETVINSYSKHQAGKARLITSDQTVASRVFSGNKIEDK